jgi:hypothetical protein
MRDAESTDEVDVRLTALRRATEPLRAPPSLRLDVLAATRRLASEQAARRAVWRSTLRFAVVAAAAAAALSGGLAHWYEDRWIQAVAGVDEPGEVDP